MIASVDPRNPVTLLQAEVVTSLGLPPALDQTEFKDPAGNQLSAHVASIRAGSRVFVSNVVSFQMGHPAIIGADLIAESVGDDPSPLFELFDDALVRALRAAAKTKKLAVLVIGPYGAELPELREIILGVETHGLKGMLLMDYPDIAEQSLPEKMLLFGSLARFVVCLDPRPSGHNTELETCARAGFVTAVLRPNGVASTWMQGDITDRHSFMKAFTYEDGQVMSAVPSALTWAESKACDLAASYDAKYPWRNKNVRLGS
jgi:hypothetical protein